MNDVLLMIVRLIICMAGYSEYDKKKVNSTATSLLVKATLRSITMYNTSEQLRTVRGRGGC